jgi:hypothetical protein
MWAIFAAVADGLETSKVILWIIVWVGIEGMVIKLFYNKN